MNRRNFIQTTGLSMASILIGDSLFASSNKQNGNTIQFPDEVFALADGKPINLVSKDQQIWTSHDISVRLKNTGTTIVIEILAPTVSLSELQLNWKIPEKIGSVVLNDHWERTYGDVSWHKPIPSELLPWYFLEYDRKSTYGFGVKTGAGAFCSWNIGHDKLRLRLDTRSGGNGVDLGDRTLFAAEIITMKSDAGDSPFQATRRFVKLMCDVPRLPKEPVYGINDWYFTYGNTSEKLILEHTQLIAPMAEGLSNRPFSMIDSGWFKGPSFAPDDCCWGDMAVPDKNFPDMGSLADKIHQLGMRPGIWTRPLCGSEKSPSSLMLPVIKGREMNKPVLDPSLPENLEKISDYFKLYKQWGYEMIKFDFTSFDIFGRWGFEMMKEGSMTESNWSMNDTSKTNAEIILNLYKTIRKAAGDTYIIGCNTISHLSAGLFELNRIGDDTSGNEWERTRKMGVNTLGFRGVQHNLFYAADGDCVGLTSKVPWDKNKQWMELVAKSGTPLFISAHPQAAGTEQKVFIKECFEIASKQQPIAEPIDWMQNQFPEKWKLNEKITVFNWS